MPKGGLYREQGLDIPALFEQVNGPERPPTLPELEAEGDVITSEELLALEVDLLIPAAVGGVIHRGNAGKVRARMVIEAANLPVTGEGDRLLAEQGVVVVPDVLANAGGVTVSYLEWVQNRQRYQWPEKRVNEELERRLHRAWDMVRERGRRDRVSYRLAAYQIALERTIEAIRLRGF